MSKEESKEECRCEECRCEECRCEERRCGCNYQVPLTNQHLEAWDRLGAMLTKTREAANPAQRQHINNIVNMLMTVQSYCANAHEKLHTMHDMMREMMSLLLSLSGLPVTPEDTVSDTIERLRAEIQRKQRDTAPN